MTKHSQIEWLKFYLATAKEYAINAGLDHHFIAEIDHLIQTAEANMEETWQKQ